MTKETLFFAHLQRKTGPPLDDCPREVLPPNVPVVLTVGIFHYRHSGNHTRSQSASSTTLLLYHPRATLTHLARATGAFFIHTSLSLMFPKY